MAIPTGKTEYQLCGSIWISVPARLLPWHNRQRSGRHRPVRTASVEETVMKRPSSLLSSLLFLVALLFLAAPLARAADSEWQELEIIVNRDPVAATAQARGAVRVARDRHDLRAELKALNLLSLARAQLSETPDATADERRGEELARQFDDMDSLCWYLDGRAWVLAEDGKLDEANRMWDDVLALAEKHRLKWRKANIYLSRGQAMRDGGRLAEAMDSFSKAYALSEAMQDRYMMARALSETGNVYSLPNANAESQAKATDYYQRALSLSDPQVYRHFYVDTSFRLGLSYVRRKDIAQARHYFDIVLPIDRAMGLHAQEADVEFQLAGLDKEAGRRVEAIAHYDRAIELYTASWAKRFLVRCGVAKAELLADLGRRQESLAALARARETLREIDTPQAQINFYPNAAKVYERLGDFEHAYRELQTAREADKRYADAANAKAEDELKVRFEVRLKDAENAALRSQQKEAESRRLALWLALALSVLLLGGIAFWLRKRAAAAATEAAHQKALADASGAASRAKSAFLANMSHELRSPLNAMLGFTNLLLRDAAVHGEAKSHLGIVLKSGEHLYGLINQILDLSKIEAGRTVLADSDFDLYALLDEIGEMFSITTAQKGLALGIDVAPDVPQYVHADQLKLRQVLINLMSNAVKFTSAGSVGLHVRKMEGKTPEACMLSFSVSDTGVGMAPDELNEIGTAFTQAGAGLHAKEGTGLGLAISRSFAELMGGGLRLSSRPGAGTTAAFDIAATLAEDGVTAADAPATRMAIGLAPGQPRYRILVADDRQESRLLLDKLLAPLGFEVREAANGQEAVVVAEHWQPHLILMDMRMPVLDGQEAARRIKASPGGRDTVVIALTASSFDEDRVQILEAGCAEFLRKPFREADLLDALHRHLGVAFVYEETAAGMVAQPEAALLAGLPAELRERLAAALDMLDVAAIEAAIDAIGLRDAASAEALRELAGRFDYARMRALLKPAGMESPDYT
jgi:signal transduction histidine kinase/FixJ family two-component response regulator